MEWLVIKTPDGEICSDQEFIVERNRVAAARLVKKMSGPGSPDDGVEVLMAHDVSPYRKIWIRCPNFNAARKLFDEIKIELGAA